MSKDNIKMDQRTFKNSCVNVEHYQGNSLHSAGASTAKSSAVNIPIYC